VNETMFHVEPEDFGHADLLTSKARLESVTG
jgi:hypothetical protein